MSIIVYSYCQWKKKSSSHPGVLLYVQFNGCSIWSTSVLFCLVQYLLSPKSYFKIAQPSLKAKQKKKSEIRNSRIKFPYRISLPLPIHHVILFNCTEINSCAWWECPSFCESLPSKSPHLALRFFTLFMSAEILVASVWCLLNTRWNSVGSIIIF